MYDTTTADSSSAVLNLKEDRGATLHVEFAREASLAGCTVTLKLGNAAEVPLTVVGSSFVLELAPEVTAELPSGTAYVIYITSVSGAKDALFRGRIDLV